jgi:hypothetical protein
METFSFFCLCYRLADRSVRVLLGIAHVPCDFGFFADMESDLLEDPLFGEILSLFGTLTSKEELCKESGTALHLLCRL